MIIRNGTRACSCLRASERGQVSGALGSLTMLDGSGWHSRRRYLPVVPMQTLPFRFSVAADAAARRGDFPSWDGLNLPWFGQNRQRVACLCRKSAQPKF